MPADLSRGCQDGVPRHRNARRRAFPRFDGTGRARGGADGRRHRRGDRGLRGRGLSGQAGGLRRRRVARGPWVSAVAVPLAADQPPDDEYGGDAERRGRLPLEVLCAVRQRVGPSFPVFVRLGMHDERPGGLTLAPACWVAAQLVAAGAALIDVSGGLSGSDDPGRGPGYFRALLGSAQGRGRRARARCRRHHGPADGRRHRPIAAGGSRGDWPGDAGEPAWASTAARVLGQA